MTKQLAPHVRQRLIRVGDALDIDKQLAVLMDGKVSLLEDDERSDNAERKCKGSAGRQGSQRRPGQGQGPQQGGPCADPWFGRNRLEAHYLSGIEKARERYSVEVTSTEYGLWVVAPSYPLGAEGPEFWLAIFLPTGGKPMPPAWGWAVSRLGQFPKFVGPRHTNFPFHDICAQGAAFEAWKPQDGIRPLLNLYSTWLFRHCYFAEVGRWPGRQWGATAIYRLAEFHPDEWCGCGSGKRYRDCHLGLDKEMSKEDAELEHLKEFGAIDLRRNPPVSVKAFARGRWKKPPPHPLIGDKRVGPPIIRVN